MKIINNGWLKMCLLPYLKDMKELSERVTAKKYSQDYLNDLRNRLGDKINEITAKTESEDGGKKWK